MDKKGNMGFMLSFFIAIAILIVVSFFIAIVVGIISITSDTIIPEIEGIGLVGNSNISEYSEYGLKPVETLINSFSWIGGITYVIALFGLFGFAVTYRLTMNKFFIVLFFAFAILLIILSILMSNIYEDIYTGTDELSVEMQNQTLLSYLILHAPMILTVVIFVSGIILFSGMNQEEYV